MARAGGWERVALHGQVLEHPTPPGGWCPALCDGCRGGRPRSGASHFSHAAGTEYFSLDVEDVPAAGSRPDRLAGVRPQEQVQRHTVDQTVDAVPGLPTLDVPVPLLVEQLVDVLQFFDVLSPDPEQVYPSASQLA